MPCECASKPPPTDRMLRREALQMEQILSRSSLYHNDSGLHSHGADSAAENNNFGPHSVKWFYEMTSLEESARWMSESSSIKDASLSKVIPHNIP